tara:strand:- start:46 stop:855 length:810 start_codon:yes stop_codon:yes gene_type:complete
MKIFISGTSGYIGKNLFNVIKKKNQDVVGINRKKIENSLTIEQFKEIEIKKDNIFIHCAGLAHAKSSKYKSFYSANVSYTKNLALLAEQKKFSKFIFISSIGVYGNSNKTVTVLSKDEPYDAYTRSKLEAELELKKIFKNSRCKLVIVRPPLVVGKNAPGNIQAIEWLLHYFPVTPFASIKNCKSIVKLETLCEILSNIDLLDEKILIPSEKEALSTKEIFDLVASFHNKKFYHLPFPKIFLSLFFKLMRKPDLDKNILGNFVVKDIHN